MTATHVDHPLETGQGTNHDDTDRQTVPEARESNVLVDPAHGRAKCLALRAICIELADHDVGRVGDDSAEDTCQVTADKRHARLGSLAVVGLLPGEAGVHHLDNGLEGGKLHHGVGNLSAPERVQALVEASPPFLSRDLADAVEGALVGGRDSALHADLYGLEGAEGDIGEELGGGRGGEEEDRLVLFGVVGAREVGVGLESCVSVTKLLSPG